MIEQTTIQDLVILDRCHLGHADRVEDSILGRAVTIKKSTNGSTALRVFVSDDSAITL